jgi:secreted trypsin-like serine protease
MTLEKTKMRRSLTVTRRRVYDMFASSALILSLLVTWAVTAASPANAVAFPSREASETEKLFTVPLLIRSGSQLLEICTGSLITNTIVLTAAHCVFDERTADLIVGSPGSSYSEIVNRKVETREVVLYGHHPSYLDGDNERLGTNDVALVVIAQPFTRFQTIAIPTARATEYALARQLTILGYGDDQNGRSPGRLMAGDVQDYSKLGNQYFKSYNPTTHVAAGAYRAADRVFIGACSGDSGGPLVGTANGSYVIVGITSYGKADCTVNAPSVFMRVSYYADFITGNMQRVRELLRQVEISRRIDDERCDSKVTSSSMYSCLDADISSVWVERKNDAVTFTYEAVKRDTTSRIASVYIDVNSDRVPDYTLRLDGLYDSSNNRICENVSGKLTLEGRCAPSTSFDATLAIVDTLTAPDYQTCYTVSCPVKISYSTDAVNLGMTFAGAVADTVSGPVVVDTTGSVTPDEVQKTSGQVCTVYLEERKCFEYPRWEIEFCADRPSFAVQGKKGSKWVTLRTVRGAKSLERCSSSSPYLIQLSGSVTSKIPYTAAYRFYGAPTSKLSASIVPLTIFYS